MNPYLFYLRGILQALGTGTMLLAAFVNLTLSANSKEADPKNSKSQNIYLPSNALEILNQQDSSVVFSYQPNPNDPDLDPTEGFYPSSYQEELWPDEVDWETEPVDQAQSRTADIKARSKATAPGTSTLKGPRASAAQENAHETQSSENSPTAPAGSAAQPPRASENIPSTATPAGPSSGNFTQAPPASASTEEAKSGVFHRSNGIVARVNDHVITWNQLNEEMASLLPQLRQAHPTLEAFANALETAKAEVLEGMINRQLIVDHFKKKGYRIPKAYSENALKDHVVEHFDNNRAKFLQFLEQQNRTRLQFVEELEKDLIVNAMNQHIRASVAGISPEKMERYYSDHRLRFFQPKRVRLQQIMLKPVTGETPEIMNQTAQSIIRRLEKGAAFEELAKKYSQDSSAEKGGHCGWLSEKDLLPELSLVAFGLQKGQSSSPIQVGEKIFILRAVDTHPERIQPLDEVREKIEAAVVKEESMLTYKRWMDGLRKEAFVTRQLDR